MADELERSAREDSGLQDILSVTNKLKDRDGLSAVEGEPEEAGDSGMIVFGSNDLESATESDDSGLMVSFAGGLGAGMAAPIASDPDLTPQGGSGGSVREARPVEPMARPAEEPKRNPLVAIAVVLGLCLAGAAAVVLSQKDDPKPQQAQNDPGMSAKEEVPATVAAQPEPAPEAATAGAGGPPVEPLPPVEPPLEGETLGPAGETDGALLAMGEGDPLAQTEGLLNADGTKKTPTASYGGGVRTKPSSTSGGAVVEEPEPEPVVEPEPEPDPLPGPKKSGSTTDQASQDEVDCLLNPDLPKCASGSKSSGKDGPVLVPKTPDKLDSTMLKTGFNTVKSKAKACGSKFGAATGTKVKIHASIEGASGKITSVEATGEHAGTDLGKCVEEAVKDASFEKFKSPAQGVDYSIVM